MPAGYKFIPTEEMIDWMHENNGAITNKEMFKMFSEEFGQIISRSRFQKFRKSLGLKSGLTGKFEKGHTSWNKGKTMKVTGRMAETQFKKGHRPLNYRPVGSERIDKKDGYILIKISDKPEWVHKHRYLWEQHHGKVPKNHVVIFLNGDKTDIRIENLRLVTRGIHARLNLENGRFENPEATNSMINIELLKKAVREKSK
ncbi:HNH endonuclease signature motif containing protein [Macrococcus armenti]|uniref:HNH endonuclease signature motif containing protein n=1 Tax=Macrococcus armenti TaxID=2875764 RepID=UPI001CD58C5E|nr:HNH endonuclease signature motif containing protein [Macrococcus armenti]UBH10103.1 HNH endonuclease [Macrococcus armenti]